MDGCESRDEFNVKIAPVCSSGFHFLPVAIHPHSPLINPPVSKSTSYSVGKARQTLISEQLQRRQIETVLGCGERQIARRNCGRGVLADGEWAAVNGWCLLDLDGAVGCCCRRGPRNSKSEKREQGGGGSETVTVRDRETRVSQLAV
ncbi:hypothetical protein WN943_016058 [Citrus x changshan-huyou]